MIYLLVVSFIVLWESCELGLRVIGGRDALQDEFPYVVRLEVKKNESGGDTIDNYFRFCTGTTLTSKWVLSAAHCVQDTTGVMMFLRYNSYLPNNTGFIASILETIVHPGHERSTMKFYFVLIRSADIKVAHYGKVNAVDFKSLIGHETLSLGFGQTNASSFEKPLQVLKGMLINCPKGVFDTSQMLCLVEQCTVEATICTGDSGGPIVHPAGIVGVNSMSHDDCDENTQVFKRTPGTAASVLSPISPVIDWIQHYCK